MEALKTIAMDITKSVFLNDWSAMMYITKDIHSDSYIVAIPVESFSYQISFNGVERDLNELLKFLNFGYKEQTQRLIDAIKEGIAAIEN